MWEFERVVENTSVSRRKDWDCQQWVIDCLKALVEERIISEKTDERLLDKATGLKE